MLPTCLPVHSGRGFRTAGMGTRPSQSSSHMSMFIMTSASMNVSRLVISRMDASVSCTMPMTGLLACSESVPCQCSCWSMHAAMLLSTVGEVH
jgi:hypothetical protein